MKSLSATIQIMKATEQYFPVALFILLYKVVLTFDSMGEILTCDHSNTSYTEFYGWNPYVWPFKYKLH